MWWTSILFFWCMAVLFQLKVKHKSSSFLMQKCISSCSFFKYETHALLLDRQPAFSKIPATCLSFLYFQDNSSLFPFLAPCDFSGVALFFFLPCNWFLLICTQKNSKNSKFKIQNSNKYFKKNDKEIVNEDTSSTRTNIIIRREAVHVGNNIDEAHWLPQKERVSQICVNLSGAKQTRVSNQPEPYLAGSSSDLIHLRLPSSVDSPRHQRLF
jgi:hypothetical protein